MTVSSFVVQIRFIAGPVFMVLFSLFRRFLLAALLVFTGSSAALAGPELQGSSLENLPQWQRIVAEFNSEIPVYDRCGIAGGDCPWKSVAAWQNLIIESRTLPVRQRLENVNLWFNKKIPYKEDSIVYGERDRWASLRDFLEKSGDCEDFAIAKYITLRQSGVPADAMQIVMVYDPAGAADHAILAVQYDAQIFVLDNRHDSIVPDERGHAYRPYFSFNEDTLWTYDELETAGKRRDQDSLPASVVPGGR